MIDITHFCYFAIYTRFNTTTEKWAMNDDKQRATLIKNQSGLELEEIKMERSINEMVLMLRTVRSEKKKEYLLNEISHHKRQLHHFRKKHFVH